MASGGTDLSTSMSAVDQNTGNKDIKEIALKHFKKYKVEISDAINTPFPFLERLRDHGFITEEKYKEYEESFKKRLSIQKGVYDILTELEDKFDLSLLGALFSKVLMKSYPDLYPIYKTFTNVIPGIEIPQESDVEENEEGPNVQLSLEQGAGENSYQRLTLPSPDSSNHDGSPEHTNGSVNFRAEILPVTCGDMMGMLIKRKFEQGTTTKCIRSEDGSWFTVREFEVKAGCKNSSNWKTSMCCGGRTLKWLMEREFLQKPPSKYGRKTKLQNSEKCKICRDGGKLFCCISCLSFFHEDCHLPPVETERTHWSCAFCTTKKLTGNQQCHRESEVLARQMGPEEKSKCEFLLLKAYYHLEGVFLTIARENYVGKASQCLEKLRMLDEIKKGLIQGDYPKVEGFVWNMHRIFEDPSCHDSDLTKEEFMKNFKEVFAIRKTN